MKTPNSLFPTLCSSSGSYHGPSQTHAHGISLLCTIIPYYSYFTICSYFGLNLAFYINSCQYLRRNFRVPDSNPCLFPQMVLSMPLTNSSCFDIFFFKSPTKATQKFFTSCLQLPHITFAFFTQGSLGGWLCIYGCEIQCAYLITQHACQLETYTHAEPQYSQPQTSEDQLYCTVRLLSGLRMMQQR